MSASTDRIYREWVARNRGGMGAVAPMETQSRRPFEASRGPVPPLARVSAARPEKQPVGVQTRNLVTEPVDMGAAGVHTLALEGKDFQ